MNNKKVAILIIYIVFMIINSLVTFSFESNLWKYDKYVHFFEFFILGILIINIFLDKLSKMIIIQSFIAVMIIGIFDESIQFLIPSRIPDIYDLIFDILGGSCGVFLLSIITMNKQKNG